MRGAITGEDCYSVQVFNVDLFRNLTAIIAPATFFDQPLMFCERQLTCCSGRWDQPCHLYSIKDLNISKVSNVPLPCNRG